jgi:quinol monooxygenase YgiN
MIPGMSGSIVTARAMFERYTERARRVLFFARYEASQLGGLTIETEHLLLGLMREGQGVTRRLFDGAGLHLDAVRKEVESAAASRPKLASSVEIPFAADGRAVLEHAADEAHHLGHGYIGTEHLFLGLMRRPESFAGAVLSRAGLQIDSVRESIVAMLTETPPTQLRHVVLVQVTIRPEMEEEFATALLHNARESVRRDPGCLRFDVSQDKEQPTRWVLYEVYDSPAAHALHRQAAHFLAYDAVASRAVVEKTVAKCAGRYVT